MPEPNKPWRVGTVRGEENLSKEKADIHKARVSAAASLKDLTEQYHFYTPALMYLYVNLMGRDPMEDFCREIGRKVVPISLNFDKPVFTGLESGQDVRWNYYLLGLEHDDFDSYVKWLGTLTIADRDAGYVARVRTREVQIADMLYIQKLVVIPKEIPIITVVAFCLDTNKGCWYIEEGQDLLLPARAKYTKLRFEQTMHFSDAVLGEQDNPYGEMEQRLAKDGPSIEETEIQQRIADARNKDGEDHGEKG